MSGVTQGSSSEFEGLPSGNRRISFVCNNGELKPVGWYSWEIIRTQQKESLLSTWSSQGSGSLNSDTGHLPSDGRLSNRKGFCVVGGSSVNLDE